ncbi:MAG: VWA domain-containing protein [Dermabacter sp.]|nr:VWA domain-containing protein [Dermabacter sp.]
MVMSLWWLTCLLLILALVAWALAYLNRKAVHERPVIVANTEFIDRLPSVQRAQRTSRILRILSLILTALLVLVSAVMAGRVASERVEAPDFANRDIVLCLDVSGSMITYDAEILSTFADLVENFKGERVGLSIFNSTSRTVFPLTNDYALIRRELEAGAQALSYNPVAHRLGSAQYSEEQIEDYWQFVDGTYSEVIPPSLIGDGVASCGQLFDQAETERSRFIVLATDNESGGEGIYTLPESTEALVSRDVTLWSFYPGAGACGGPQCGDELKTESERTGGQMWSSRDPAAIPAIVGEIQKAQAVEMGAVPRVVRTDHPGVAFALTLVLTVLLVGVGWRSR